MQAIINRFKECRRVIRIVAFGSSNTQRPQTNGNSQNWVDWNDLGLAWWYGRFHISVNAGINGQTSQEMLERFETDVELFRPHIVFITCGGNDCNPAKKVSLNAFKGNLATMIARCRALPDCHPILQTYYSGDIEGLKKTFSPGYDSKAVAEAFPIYMQAIRYVASQTGCLLIDHLKRWEPIRLSDYPLYRSMMFDLMHMSALGHTVFGLDVLRQFGVTPLGDWKASCADALRIQKMMDDLETR